MLCALEGIVIVREQVANQMRLISKGESTSLVRFRKWLLVQPDCARSSADPGQKDVHERFVSSNSTPRDT